MRGPPLGHGISPARRSRMPLHKYKNKSLTGRWPPSSRIAFPIPWIQPSSPAPSGKPDTYVVTGDIDAMWLRDSSAQVTPYLALAKQDNRLRELLEGVIRRQARLILIDAYANAFMRDTAAPPLSWAVNDKTKHYPGVGERKWEVDSLCYPIRLAYGYWQQTGDTGPFDAQWKEAAWTIVRTFRTQQRKHDRGPYSFQRLSDTPTDTLALSGFGSPAIPGVRSSPCFAPPTMPALIPYLFPEISSPW